MAGTSSSLPGCENIDLILAATGMGECICISKRCLVLLFRYVAAYWSSWLYVHSCTHTHTHTTEHTEKQGKITDSEGSRVANVLLMLLGKKLQEETLNIGQ